MENLLKNRFNCFNLSTIGDGDIIDFTKTNSTDIFNVMFYPYLFLNYMKYNETHFQWCGPMLLIVEYFGRFTKSRVRIFPKVEIETFVKGNVEDIYDILMVPFTAKDYQDIRLEIQNNSGTDVQDFTRISSTFMYRYIDRVLSSTIKGKHTPFKIFESFDGRIYYLSILAILIMALVVGLYRGSLNVFFSTLWSYISVILSDFYTLSVESAVERTLCGVWLMSCTILLAAFSGLLRDLMIKPKPLYWIDNWHDLSEWQHLTIWTSSVSGVYYYVRHFKEEPMARNLVDRLNPINIDDLAEDLRKWDTDIDYLGVKKGRIALMGDLIYMQTLKQNLITRYDMIEDIDFHISLSDDLASQPAFIVTNRYTFDESEAQKLNLVIDILRESGITTEMNRRTLYPNATLAMMNSDVMGSDYQYEPLLTSHLSGSFTVFLYGIFISLFCCIFEFLCSSFRIFIFSLSVTEYLKLSA